MDEFYGSHGSVYLTDVLSPNDPRSNDEFFRETKTAEIDGLRKRGTWNVLKKESLPVNANILGGRFILAVKNVDTNEEKAKARYVAQGFHDREKYFVAHNSIALRQYSVLVIVLYAATNGFRLFTHDVT